MQIKPRLPKETGRDYALRILKENIISLNLEPGSMISENELAQALSLSRTPVREALIELSKVEIVEIYPQKGSRIALIDDKMVGQAFFMRETLECEIIREVCRTAGPYNIEKLSSAIRVQELYNASGSLEIEGQNVSFMQLDNHFHQILYEIASKEMVFRIIQEIVIHFDRVRNMTISYVKPAAVISEHKKILEAIKAGDEEAAVAAMQYHLGRFRGIEKELREQYPAFFAVE